MIGVLLLLWASGSGRVVTVDMLERNTTGTLEQVIFWEWSQEFNCYCVMAWVQAADIEQIDVDLWRHKSGWKVRAKATRFTTTLCDPERANLWVFPDCYRKGMPWERRKGR